MFCREATKDLTERTVLDWASGLVGKATQHVTAVAANKVLGTPLPKGKYKFFFFLPSLHLKFHSLCFFFSS